MNKWHDAVKRSHDCLRDLSTGSARQRVARLFLLLAGDGCPCQLFGREDMGALLGVTTETASRSVAEFKRQGLVREVGANLFDCDQNALKTLAAAE
jgi:CRP-like cAMP-binding protein